MKLKGIFFVIPLCLLLAACGGIPQDALRLSPNSMENRQIQSRKFEAKESDLLSASLGVLQDLGYNLEESETKLGVISASKSREAYDSGQVALNFLSIVLGGGGHAIDSTQTIKASVVTNTVDGTDNTSVRVTFQRVVYNTDGMVSRAEQINRPELYQEFFAKLSKSLFIEAQEI